MTGLISDLGARLMLESLDLAGPFCPCGVVVAERSARREAEALAAAGLVEARPDRAGAAVEIHVLNAGARALIQAGRIRERDLARQAGQVLAYAARGRRDAEVGRVEARLGDPSRAWVMDRPHGRASVQTLARRGLVEVLAPESPAELTWGQGRLIVRATDAGLAA